MGTVLIIIGVLLIVGAIFALRYYYSQGDTSLIDRTERIDLYDHSITGAQINRQHGRSQARTQLVGQLSQEMVAVGNLEIQKQKVPATELEAAEALPRKQRELELERLGHNTEAENQMLQKQLIMQAKESGLNVETMLEVLKTRALNEAELQKLESEAKLKLQAAFTFQLGSYRRMMMLREQLDQLYERSHEIETGSDPEAVKKRKLDQNEKDIAALEADINGRRSRLLQAGDGQDPEGSDTDSVS